MTTDPLFPVPRDITESVEEYVDAEIRDWLRYENRTPFDESGCWSLHRLAAKVYAQGWTAGVFAGQEEIRRSLRRRHDMNPDA